MFDGNEQLFFLLAKYVLARWHCEFSKSPFLSPFHSHSVVAKFKIKRGFIEG